jgi:hypothetical protein
VLLLLVHLARPPRPLLLLLLLVHLARPPRPLLLLLLLLVHLARPPRPLLLLLLPVAGRSFAESGPQTDSNPRLSCARQAAPPPFPKKAKLHPTPTHQDNHIHSDAVRTD